MITNAIEILKRRMARDEKLLAAYEKEKNKPIKKEKTHCLLCEKTLGPRQTLFCSIKCRNTSNGFRHVGCKKQVHMYCKQCGCHYMVPFYRKGISKFCSKKCLGASKRKIIHSDLQEAMC